MERATWRRYALGGLFLTAFGVAGAGLLGCDQGCEVDATCVYDTNDGGALGGDCPADPATGDVGAECGIWVSTSLGQDSFPGTQGQPVQTLTHALALANGSSKRVYACGGIYEEAVSVPSGVSMFGGFDCMHGWLYTGTSNRARILAGPGEIALTFLGGDEQSLAGDLVVRSADAVKPGDSSIAVLVREHVHGSLKRADVFAGDGADGADGEDGGHDGNAADGLPGNDGSSACTVEPGPGGASVKLSCGDGTFSLGGPGGDGGELVASNGGDGLPLPDPNPASYGVGGKGEAMAPMCTSGQGGAQGAPGSDGAPVAQLGLRRITDEGVVLGGNGGDGQPGFPGQGGGGGGASFGKAIVCGAAPPGGAGGGSGGTGGCGGKGGRGGQAGGASIGIAARSQGFSCENVQILAGTGGNGGRGGQSQPGGQGGLPGVGGQAFGGVGGVHSGCIGGGGGNGGNGGYGAGGRGGDSIAVAEVGIGNVPLDDVSNKENGQPGHGGKGGNPAAPEQDGKDGMVGRSFGYEP